MRVSCLCLLLGVLLVPARSVAQDSADASEPRREIPPQARAAFAQAESAYERELFTEAEDSFRRAYELVPVTNPRRALLLLNIAVVVERQTGRDGEALELWERFRREAASVAEAELLVRADDRIRELRARIERRQQDATTAEAPTPDSDVASESISPVGPVVLGIGGATLVAGAILGGVVLAQDASLVAMCPGGRCNDPSALSLARDVEQMAIATDALFIAGSVVAATGLLLTVLLKDQTVHASAGCGPDECGLLVRGVF